MLDSQTIPMRLSEEAAVVHLSVPSYYAIDANGTLYASTDMGDATAWATVVPADTRYRIPVGDPQEIIDGLRHLIVDDAKSDEQWGIIEVQTGKTAQHARDYSFALLKVLGENGDLCYTFWCDIHEHGDIVKIEGVFREGPVTGIRASVVMADLLERGEVSVESLGEDSTGWTTDPYDPEWTAGALMNRSEDECYDKMFPTHPLSLARALASHLVSMN